MPAMKDYYVLLPYEQFKKISDEIKECGSKELKDTLLPIITSRQLKAARQDIVDLALLNELLKGD